MREVLSKGIRDDALLSKFDGKKGVQMRMLQRMIAIDRDRALACLKALAKFIHLAERQHTIEFATLEDNILHRVVDAGELYLLDRISRVHKWLIKIKVPARDRAL